MGLDLTEHWSGRVVRKSNNHRAFCRDDGGESGEGPLPHPSRGRRLWPAGLAFYSKIDLGIVKYHFEVGSGKGPSVWK